LVLQDEGGGFVTRQLSQVGSATHAWAVLQHMLLTQASQAAMPVKMPQPADPPAPVDELPVDELPVDELPVDELLAGEPLLVLAPPCPPLAVLLVPVLVERLVAPPTPRLLRPSAPVAHEIAMGIRSTSESIARRRMGAL
jgi:hypothetical protein